MTEPRPKCTVMGMPNLTFERLRTQLYTTVLGLRQDSMLALWEAVLTAPGPLTPARLSCHPDFRRRWPSAYDALLDGRLDVAAARRLLAEAATDAGEIAGRVVLAADHTTWPRPDASRVPERSLWPHGVPGARQTVGVPGWRYLWVARVPGSGGNAWALPLTLRRLPAADTPTVETTLAVLRTELPARAPDAARPVLVLDAGNATGPLVAAVRTGTAEHAPLPLDLLIRVRRDRVFFQASPPRVPGQRGRPRRHGRAFRLANPDPTYAPVATTTTQAPGYGTLTVTVWTGLHERTAPDQPLTLVRITAERLPRRDRAHHAEGRAPEPIWLVWTGIHLPADPLSFWHWYRARFAIEHLYRFVKHDLGWTAYKPLAPTTADRWTWLLALAVAGLWRLRPQVADQKLPWEPVLPPERVGPGRVRRAARGVFRTLPSLARPPVPRGKPRGRCPGTSPGRRPLAPPRYGGAKPAA
jgi:hypothetical protein